MYYLSMKKKKRKSIENIIYQSEAPIYDVLLTALQEGDIDFNDNGKETAQYWFTYVKRKSSKSKASRATTKKKYACF